MAEKKSTPATDAPKPAAAPVTEAKSESVAVPEKKKSNKTLWIVLGLVIFFVVIVPGLVLGAGALWLNKKVNETTGEKIAEGIIESATGSNVDINSDSGGFSVESEDGNTSFSAGSDQKLPDDFPKSAVNYLKEKAVTSVLTSSSDGKKTWYVTTTVDKSLSDTVAYFEGKIVEPEYSSTSNYSFNDTHSFYGETSTHTVSVLVAESDGKVTVSYTVSEK